MDGEITVTVVSTTTSAANDLGDTTTSTTETVISGVLFAPRGSQERTSTRIPAVYTAGALYFSSLPSGFTFDSDDTIRIQNVSPLINGTYQIDGIPGYWGGAVEVAVSRTGGV